ncbi:ricin-type beta-trefoil lectin domain protein [Actinoplanes sp. KI2]|uniref:RICIN domain-containing protein n=1 Tax=Actinoplanes sp. KI2 TaxID=2983315 RepID=UPI0021D594C1|nr:RICIN domain-containing protein [Actinoplanes sp. KI2]MCU7722821.1 ricin-type beta-trefoil lectin domain protein [Actinoplanes sp. KI2]
MTDMYDDRRPTDRSATAQPDTALRDTARPDTALPDTAQPDTSSPDTSLPDTSLPDTSLPNADRPDPVLVRPYVGPAPDRPGRGPAEAPTVIQPAIVDEPPTPLPSPPPRRTRLGVPLRLSILAAGLAIALAVAGWLVYSPDEHTSQPAAVLPQFTPDLPADPASVSARASASHSPSPSASSSSASASPSAGASSSPSASPPTTSTLAPPPAADRTGKVTAASGRCLALGGLLGTNGSPVQVATCVDLPAQQFTLARDGTLRVSGRCAQVTGDATVHIAGCGSSAAEQWRAGPSHALVNPSTNRCLTDPGTAGATAKVTACTGGGTQSWTLP